MVFEKFRFICVFLAQYFGWLSFVDEKILLAYFEAKDAAVDKSAADALAENKDKYAAMTQVKIEEEECARATGTDALSRITRKQHRRIILSRSHLARQQYQLTMARGAAHQLNKNRRETMITRGICLQCGGSGTRFLFFTCSACNGAGKVSYCQACNGKGRGWIFTCRYCGGSGRVG